MTAIRLGRLAPRSVLVAIAAAWGLALVGAVSSLGERVHHHALVDSGLPVAMALALFLAVWQVHVAAMMLPSSLPLLTLFDGVVVHQPRPRAARGAFLGGYAVVWTAFAVVALVGDLALHEVVDRSAWLSAHPAVIEGGLLILAGAFQFSALKDRCLRECRHPAAFLTRHYRRGSGAAFLLGTRHGVHCLGCCWALMLVLVAVGTAELLLMAPLTLLMIAEKSPRVGPQVTAPTGIALIALGLLTMLGG